MSAKHGNLSINSDNIFPIIKNGCIPTTVSSSASSFPTAAMPSPKLKKLDGMGEYTLPDDYKAAIQVIVNPDEKP